MDVDDIRPGEDFERTIEERIRASRVLVAVIGSQWLSASHADGKRRLDDPQDFVRREISAALAGDVRVIPVLVEGAHMPSAAELPSEIAPFAQIQAAEISDARFEDDARRLIQALDPGHGAKRAARLPITAVLALAFIALAGALLWRAFPRNESMPPVVLSPSAPSIEGRWHARVDYDWGATHQERFDFRLVGGELVGSAAFLGVPRAIAEGKVDGGRVSFVTRSDEQLGADTREQRHRYRGELAADEIRFVLQTEGGFSSHPMVEFVARRAPLE